MLLKDISFQTPRENILYDEVLLRLAEEGAGGEVLRFWESQEVFIVLGRISRLNEDIKIEAVLEDRVSVLRRSSGGGTVVQGKGCLNYSLILSKEDSSCLLDLGKSYRYILRKVIAALGEVGVAAVFHPVCDIALLENQKKISGNAQKRARKFILHHGTILCHFDIDKIERYLAMPKNVPEYRRGRSHAEFVANILVPPQAVKDALRKVFGATSTETSVTAQERFCLSRLLNSRSVLVELLGLQ